MKKILIGALISISTFSGLLADTYVNGYTKSNGTYVKGHYRSSPNSSKNDNWSTKGNTNPYTGRAGTKPREYENSLGGYNSSSNYGKSKSGLNY